MTTEHTIRTSRSTAARAAAMARDGRHEKALADTRPIPLPKTAPRPEMSAPWGAYDTFGHLLGGDPVKLSPRDYDYAAHCVNVHDDLVAALREVQRVLVSCGDIGKIAPQVLAAIAKAEGRS